MDHCNDTYLRQATFKILKLPDFIDHARASDLFVSGMPHTYLVQLY